MDRRELFERMTYVDIHHKTIDEAISTLEELKKKYKNNEKYSNLKLLLGLDGEEYIRLKLYGNRMENDKEFEIRKKMLESSKRRYAEKQLEKDKEEYARLTEKYPDGIPE